MYIERCRHLPTIQNKGFIIIGNKHLKTIYYIYIIIITSITIAINNIQIINKSRVSINMITRYRDRTADCNRFASTVFTMDLRTPSFAIGHRPTRERSQREQHMYKINVTDGKYGHPTRRVKNNNMYTDRDGGVDNYNSKTNHGQRPW